MEVLFGSYVRYEVETTRGLYEDAKIVTLNVCPSILVRCGKGNLSRP